MRDTMKTTRATTIMAAVLGMSATLASNAWAGDAKAQFERLKSLVGEWTTETSDGGEKMETAITYRLTGQGSALVETIGPGTPYEMVTIYHLDGDDLVLTHYCGLGNQPRMKAEPSDDSKKIVFKFTGGTNLKPETDMHMHNLTFTLDGANHVHTDWQLYKDGKEAGMHSFDLTRKQETK